MKKLGCKFALIARHDPARPAGHSGRRRRSSSWASTCRAGRSSSTRSIKENLPAKLQHGRADLGAEAPRRSRRASARSRSARSAATGSRSSCPRPSAEEVEEVKRNADRRRRAGVPDPGQPQARRARSIDRALGPNGRTKPPRATCGPGSARSRPAPIPKFTAETITDPAQNWKKNVYAGTKVELTGKDTSGAEQTVVVPVEKNTREHAHPDAAARPQVDHVVPGRVQPERHPRRRPDQPPARATRSSARRRSAPGEIERSILCNVDRQDVTGKYLSRVYSTTGRAAPAGRRLRVQPPGGAQVRHS